LPAQNIYWNILKGSVKKTNLKNGTINQINYTFVSKTSFLTITVFRQHQQDLLTAALRASNRKTWLGRNFQTVFPFLAFGSAPVNEHGLVGAASHADRQQLAFYAARILERFPGQPLDLVASLLIVLLHQIANFSDA